MTSLLESLPCEACHVDLGEKRNKIASIVSGFFFFSGWWFAFDVSATDYQNTLDVFHVCGVLSAVSMFMINSISNEQLRGESYTDGVCGGVGAKIWFFFGFLTGFGSLMGSCYILIGEYIMKDDYSSVYPGVAFFLQNLFIFFSSLVFKFGRTEDLWG